MEICINYNGRREWVELPATIEDIAELFGVDLEETTDFEEEFTIEDAESDIHLPYIPEITFDWFNELAECENNYHDAAVAIEEAYSLTEVNMQTCRNAIVYKVGNAEELGAALVVEGYFEPIPDHLRDYLDYEKIGESFEDDGTYTSVGFLFNL